MKHYLIHSEPDNLLHIKNDLLASGFELIDEMTDNNHTMLFNLDDDTYRDLHLNDNRVIEIIPFDEFNSSFYTLDNVEFDSVYSDYTTPNWGLAAHSRTTTPFNYNGNFTGEHSRPFNGEGVDIVIMDTGIKFHPEFEDQYGNNRIQKINWLDGYTGHLLFRDEYINDDRMDEYYDSDFRIGGHGTLSASTAAGLMHGWAPNAHIYDLKVKMGYRSEASNLPAYDMSFHILDALRVVKFWHQRKTNGRPTVINMSWAYRRAHNPFVETTFSGIYRQIPYEVEDNKDLVKYKARALHKNIANQRDPSLETLLTENFFNYTTNSHIDDLIDVGIHVVKSAGNDSLYYAEINDIDWDNRNSYGLFRNRFTGYNGICVGAIAPSTEKFSAEESYNSSGRAVTQHEEFDKAWYSNFGPGVDIWAAANANAAFTLSDYQDGSGWTAPWTWQGASVDPKYVNAPYGGTSQAGPQVAGMLAAMLSDPTNTNLTPGQAKQLIKDTSRQDRLQTTTWTEEQWQNLHYTQLDQRPWILQYPRGLNSTHNPQARFAFTPQTQIIDEVPDVPEYKVFYADHRFDNTDPTRQEYNPNPIVNPGTYPDYQLGVEGQTLGVTINTVNMGGKLIYYKFFSKNSQSRMVPVTTQRFSIENEGTIIVPDNGEIFHKIYFNFDFLADGINQLEGYPGLIGVNFDYVPVVHSWPPEGYYWHPVNEGEPLVDPEPEPPVDPEPEPPVDPEPVPPKIYLPIIDDPQAPEVFAHNATFSNFNMSGSFRITR